MTVTYRASQIPDFDILDGRFYDDPWETYRWLRNNAPIFWDQKSKLWLASKHEDVSHISRHPELYCNRFGVRPRIAAPMSIITMDDPEHATKRRLINKGFTPRMVSKLEAHVRDLANQIIDEIGEKGECDFVEDFAIHVPLIVIAELLGLDPSARMQLYRWSDVMMAGDGATDPDDPRLINAALAFGEYAGVVSAIARERRANPREDIISILTGAYEEGVLKADEQELKNDELLNFLAVLVVAGNETTRNGISGGLMAFSRYPDQKRKLLENPELINSAVEEIVRYVSPVLSFVRTIEEDHEYKRQHLKKGQQILMLYQSANRDEDVFENPDEFDIARDPNPHLAFGIGPHFCLGANLARMEIRVVFQELLRRLPDIEAKDPYAVDRAPSSLVIAFQHLKAKYTPESKQKVS